MRHEETDHIPIDPAVNPLPAGSLMEGLFRANIDRFNCCADTAYKNVDTIEVCDDKGIQNSIWISPQIYRKLIRPYHRRVHHHIKTKIGAPILLPTDGSVSSLIPNFIELDVDIHEILPLGTPEGVSDEGKRCIDTLDPRGGFVFATAHNITEGIPLENILAAFHTAKVCIMNPIN